MQIFLTGRNLEVTEALDLVHSSLLTVSCNIASPPLCTVNSRQ
jgi:hypothetical protein